jgi:hypothetical protein
MATCDAIISRDITPNCLNPLVRGLEDAAIIINRDDIDFDTCTFDTTNKNQLKTLVLKTGKRGYTAKQLGDSFSGTGTSMVKGTYKNRFDNTFNLLISDNDPSVKEDIINIANGTFVVVVENKHKNLSKATTPGDSTFEIFGFDAGLNAETIESLKYDEETQGGWLISLKETGSGRPPLAFFNTSITTTRTAFNALLTV